MTITVNTMTTVYLVRHGETEWNRIGLYQGTTDILLNRTGLRQADELAERLRCVDFHAIYTSPLRRARVTAERIASGRHIDPVILPDLNEISYGQWQGRPMAPRDGVANGLERQWRVDPWSVRFPGGESLPDVEARAASILRRIWRSHPDQTVLVCGHGHFNRCLLILARGWERERFWEIEQLNGGWEILEVDGSLPVAPGRGERERR
jgi:broad specificity phosphatase PhoE